MAPTRLPILTPAGGNSLLEDILVVALNRAPKLVGNGVWDKLSENATIIEPFGPAQWAPGFGMLTDSFGITWILDVAAAY